MRKKYLSSIVVLLSFCTGLVAQNSISELLIPGGEFQMGDHYGFVDPAHPSDEIPLHMVRLDSLYMGTYLITNQQYCDYLNSAKSKGQIEVRNKKVYAVGDTTAYYLTNQYLSYYSISWNGTTFSVADFRANHPVVGVQWSGAAAYCNWLSQQNSLSSCYTLSTGNCDFTKNGYRLPTEAEWEFAGRGGKYNPYYVFPWGNDTTNHSIANWPGSGDPYESGPYPWTTPVDFYDGKLKLQSTYNWPGNQTSYQTANGVNAYGLYDMCGNVWQFINDWYETNYYTTSPYQNPPGPTTGSAMPDGKPCHGMRGGNWWSGTNGWSRVSNRDPSYYRGPGNDWFHVGFRVARYARRTTTGINDPAESTIHVQNSPNPFSSNTVISYSLSGEEKLSLKIYDSLGHEIATLADETQNEGAHSVHWSGQNLGAGIYFCQMMAGNQLSTIKMVLLK